MERFKAGDRVWIERTDFVENADMIRNVQVVENVYDVPCSDEPDSQCINIVGSKFIFGNEDLKHEK